MQLRAILFMLMAVTMFACKEEKKEGKVEVTGVLKNLDSLRVQFPGTFDSDSIKVILYEIPFSGDATPIQVDSDYVKSDGKFALEAPAPKQSIYDVAIDKGPMIPLINDGAVKLEIDLTEKELLIIDLICREYSSKQIAPMVHLSARTVENYRNRIAEKMGVQNTAGIVVYAIKHGIFKP